MSWAPKRKARRLIVGIVIVLAREFFDIEISQEAIISVLAMLGLDMTLIAHEDAAKAKSNGGEKAPG